jgi:hypothetical protein
MQLKMRSEEEKNFDLTGTRTPSPVASHYADSAIPSADIYTVHLESKGTKILKNRNKNRFITFQTHCIHWEMGW